MWKFCRAQQEETESFACVQELKAGAFAGNPEALAQFCRVDKPAAPANGLSRGVLILGAPLVEGKSQARSNLAIPSSYHGSFCLGLKSPKAPCSRSTPAVIMLR